MPFCILSIVFCELLDSTQKLTFVFLVVFALILVCVFGY
jgi:hypothetical protein